jgi:hypothetical protein
MRLGREAGHSLPPIAEVKNEWSCTLLPLDALLNCTAKLIFTSAVVAHHASTAPPRTARQPISFRI